MSVQELRQLKTKVEAVLERGHFPQLRPGMSGDEGEAYTKKWQEGKRNARQNLIMLNEVLAEKGWRPSEITKRVINKFAR
jgi:hypothetical protein